MLWKISGLHSWGKTVFYVLVYWILKSLVIELLNFKYTIVQGPSTAGLPFLKRKRRNPTALMGNYFFFSRESVYGRVYNKLDHRHNMTWHDMTRHNMTYLCRNPMMTLLCLKVGWESEAKVEGDKVMYRKIPETMFPENRWCDKKRKARRLETNPGKEEKGGVKNSDSTPFTGEEEAEIWKATREEEDNPPGSRGSVRTRFG